MTVIIIFSIKKVNGIIYKVSITYSLVRWVQLKLSLENFCTGCF